MTQPLRIGILALQGAVQPHRVKLARLGVDAPPVRDAAELAACQGLILPGGESTTMLKLIHDDALWQRMMNVNLNSVYHVTKFVAPMMVEAKWGRIINIASIASKVGGKYIAAYTAAKHGVLGLTRALAIELASTNITVNAICPGYVDTPLTDKSVNNITRLTKLSEAEARATLEKLRSWTGVER